MEYQGPTADDLVNVAALNRRFLSCNPRALQDACSAIYSRELTELELSRLAAAPFLLFSFREQDSDYWHRLLGDGPQPDLLEQGEPPDARLAELQVTGLAFMWHLVRRNPYAARIVSGAPMSWCEGLASLTLAGLLCRTAGRGDLLCVRFAERDRIWRRLLGNGISPLPQLRLASHHSALQAMLTPAREPAAGRMAAAACAMPASSTRNSRRATPGFRTTKV